MSDGGGVALAIYGAIGPQGGGYGTIRLSHIDSDFYAGCYLEERAYRGGPSISFEMLVGPLIWVRAVSDYAQPYLKLVQASPRDELERHMPPSAFGRLMKLVDQLPGR
jgi:hypothetical protein